jgi:hypothetical protein
VHTLVQGEEIGMAGAIIESPGNIRGPQRNAMRHALRAAARLFCSCPGWIDGEGS